MTGALYFMLPGLIIALVVASGLVLSYRTQRTYVVLLIWLAIILLAALFGAAARAMAVNQFSVVVDGKTTVGFSFPLTDAHLRSKASAILINANGSRREGAIDFAKMK